MQDKRDCKLFIIKLQHKFQHDSNQHQNSASNAPLLNEKLAGYSQEELEEYRQVFNVFDTGYLFITTKLKFRIF